MAVFILIEEDAFNQTLAQIAGQKTSPSSFVVRRPLRGIQLTGPTYTNIRVLRRDGSYVHMRNSAKKPNSAATMSANFIIRAVVEARQEKFQLLETFGETFGFFFGERPRILQFQGSLMNTPDFDWHTEWWHNYEHVFRGTKLVQENARMYIQIEDKVVEGYMLDANTQSVADPNPNFVSLSFSFWVTGYTPTKLPGGTIFPRPYLVGEGSSADLQAVAKEQRTRFYDNEDEYLLKEGAEDIDDVGRMVFFPTVHGVHDQVLWGMGRTLQMDDGSPWATGEKSAEPLRAAAGPTNGVIAVEGVGFSQSTPAAESEGTANPDVEGTDVAVPAEEPVVMSGVDTNLNGVPIPFGGMGT
jgi:hypothetical protein